MNKKIYLALAMDGIDRKSVRDREDAFQKLLASLPVDVFSMINLEDTLAISEKDKLSRAKNIVRKELEVLKSCDILLVDYSKKNHNYIGCTCEIVYAHFMRKPVIVYVGDSGYEDRIWLLFHSTEICLSLDSVVLAVSGVLEKLC
jgi:nucleoside 2-deoxyribosyltransferase